MKKDSQDAIRVSNLSKMFKIYSKPADMFWELVKDRPLYKPFWALRDVSFEVHRGQVVGIIGRNGAGKSTLLKIIAGTLDKTSGEVMVNGRISSILELGTGFHGEYTGRENIYLGGLMVGLKKEEVTHKMDWIIEFSELEDFIDQPFKTYSSGMQARLTFSTAVCIDPDILIIDEALAVGDARFSRKCFAKIDEFRKASHTILLVSHDVNTVSTFCDHAIMLENGRIFDQGEPHRISKVYYKILFCEDGMQEEESLAAGPTNVIESATSKEPDLSANMEHIQEKDTSSDMPLAAEMEFLLDTSKFAHDNGFAWRVDLTGIPIAGDSNKKPQQSILILHEDEIPLGPAHCGHDMIRKIGKGCFSHWGKQLYFSCSDNSDPRQTGRTYCLKRQETRKDFALPKNVAVPEKMDPAKIRDRETLLRMALQRLRLREAYSQSNLRQMRAGNKKAEILDFGILDERGQRVMILKSGEKYVPFFRAVFYEDVENANPGFLIRSLKGVDMFGLNMITQEAPYPHQKKGDIVEARLHLTMWLSNGTYFITFAVGDPYAETNFLYDIYYDAFQFEVEMKKGIFTTSVVDLDAKIECETLK
jgi:ABC-type polysaccharide/polyol phosphate transport system ATPase subunit